MFGHFRFLVFIFVIFSFLFPATGFPARIKDIVSIKGIRPNQLFGYGLVFGLNGTGDKGQSKFTIQGLANMLGRMGIHVDPQKISVKNVAAVMVSATFPAFARIGKKIDVTLSSIGDASSLQGGTLLLTPLTGVDGKVYALAQGHVTIGGFSAGGAAGGGVTKNHPTVGRISGGATVEKEVPVSIQNKNEFTLILKNPDFTTAIRTVAAINARLGLHAAQAIDSGTVKLRIPQEFQNNTVALIAKIGDIEVQPDSVAKVVVNEKTGTVVIGKNVRIQQVAVAHGNLSIQIKETQAVSQPPPFGPSGGSSAPLQMDGQGNTIVAPGGNTIVTPESDVSVMEEKKALVVIPPANTLSDLVRALNAIGLSPRDLITILQVIKAAGALQGELETI